MGCDNIVITPVCIISDANIAMCHDKIIFQPFWDILYRIYPTAWKVHTLKDKHTFQYATLVILQVKNKKFISYEPNREYAIR